MAAAKKTGDLQKARQAAQIGVVQAKQACSMKFYNGVAKQLPLQIRQHGLGQMLVYLRNRGKGREASPYTVLSTQIEEHLAQALSVDSGDLVTLTEHDSYFYMRATRQTELFLRELLPLAEKFV